MMVRQRTLPSRVCRLSAVTAKTDFGQDGMIWALHHPVSGHGGAGLANFTPRCGKNVVKFIS